MSTDGLRIMSVVGARPNFMKAAPIMRAIEEHNRAHGGEADKIHHILIHTGQHYDAMMSDAFFQDLDLPEPDIFLGVGSGSHAAQTAKIMKAFEPVVLAEKPQVLLVVGDVNSTVACAMVAAKMTYVGDGSRPLVGHVEAGLRSFDRSMPEEINRIVTDHLSDLLFVTEESGVVNLEHEGVPPDRVHLVGNTMIDTLLSSLAKAGESTILEKLGLKSPEGGDRNDRRSTPFILLTLHRPSNVDRREAFIEILESMIGRDDMAVVFPVHPRTRARIGELKLDRYFHFVPDGGGAIAGKLNAVDPLGYLDFLNLMKNASLVVTDSGGIQEETTCLGVPCVTVRENTERPVTVLEGTNVLAGLRKHAIAEAIRKQLTVSTERRSPPRLWDGRAAERIVQVILENYPPRTRTGGRFVAREMIDSRRTAHV